ncbi:MAG TPA: DUF427 domain-containing protein, partial [Chloroflexota bacterium]
MSPIRIEKSPRWVRGLVGGQTIVDSKNVIVVYGERRLPLYYFPRGDVRTELLTPSSEESGIQRFSLPGVADIAWAHASDDDEFAPLREYVGFEWRKVESWYEEDDEVFVHPRDPYHRVDVLNSSRHVKVVLDGEVVADS